MHLLANKEEIAELEQELEHKFYASIVHIQSEEVVDDHVYQAVNLQDGFNSVSAWLDQEHPAVIEDEELVIKIRIYSL